VSRPRVLVACDRIGGLHSATAGRAVASGFAAVADVAVLPLAAGGPDLATALAGLLPGTVHREGPGWWLATSDTIVVGFGQPSRPSWAPDATTRDLGDWLRLALDGRDQPRVVLDLTGVTAHDAGAGLVAAGGVPAGRELVGLVPAAELGLPATGAVGMLARRAHGAGLELAGLLAADAGLRDWIDAEAPGLGSVPGSGAAGGAALVVLAHGGHLMSATQFCYRIADAGRTVRAADLVVTGCTELSALDRGGEVVSAVAEWAAEAQRPCIAFTTGTSLSSREVRTFGLESAHPLPDPVTLDGVQTVAARIAGGWFPARGWRDVH